MEAVMRCGKSRVFCACEQAPSPRQGDIAASYTKTSFCKAHLSGQPDPGIAKQCAGGARKRKTALLRTVYFGVWKQFSVCRLAEQGCGLPFFWFRFF